MGTVSEAAIQYTWYITKCTQHMSCQINVNGCSIWKKKSRKSEDLTDLFVVPTTMTTAHRQMIDTYIHVWVIMDGYVIHVSDWCDKIA